MSKPAAVPDLMLTRSELAARVGCNIETIRYYERIGLLPAPPRTKDGHRLYGDALLRRLNFVRRSRDLGFTLEEIRRVLSMVDGGHNACQEVEALVLQHAHDIERDILRLKERENALLRLASQCRRRKEHDCQLIDLLSNARVRS